MTAASTSDARKRNTVAADPVEIVARAIAGEFQHHASMYRSDAIRAIAALRAEGFTL